MSNRPDCIKDKRRRLADQFDGSAGPLHHVAIRYLMSDPDVATVLAGPACIEELCDVMSAAERGPLSEQDLDTIRDIQSV